MSITISGIVFTNIQADKLKDETLRLKTNNIKLVKETIEEKITKSIEIAEIVTKISAGKNTLFYNLINDTLHGIPDSVDIEKRQLAKTVLDTTTIFESVGFILANGDVYMIEPYSEQLKLTANNFAFREYYQGSIKQNSTYVGDVIISKATGNRIIPIAIPVHDDGNLVGIWVYALDLEYMKTSLDKLKLTKDIRILILDSKNNIIIDTDDPLFKNEIEIFPYHEIVKKNRDKIDNYIERINGVKNFIMYEEISTKNINLSVVRLEPYDSAFAVVTSTVISSYVAILVGTLAIIVSSYFVLKWMSSNVRLIELDKINKYKEELLSVIKHEFKTPLFPIIGYSEMLSDSMGALNEEQKNAVNKINKNAKKLENVAQQILDAEALATNQFSLHYEKIFLEDLIKEITQKFSSRIAEKGIQLVSKVETDSISCDKKRLTQVLDNIIDNAISFVVQGSGKIEIQIKEEEQKVVFSVTDNGDGIPREMQEKIFERFFQANSSKRRTHQGTGLSLVIAKGIIEAHGGKIWFESEERIGTTFFFYIPKEVKN